ncbi:MAG: STAS domain-containing protein, partial [Patescibacteria group bacterium]
MIAIDIEECGEITILQLKEDLRDVATISFLQDELNELLSQGKCQIVIDISGVTNIISYACGRLLALAQELIGRGEKLRICGLSSNLQQNARLTNLM